MDYSSNRAPAAVGMSNQVKAVDETARITMEDYGLTDLRTDVRQGETAAPKLPGKLQHMADTMFSGGTNRGGMMRGINTGQLARRAMGGAFSPSRTHSPDPISVIQGPREKPPVRILNTPSERRR
jgi:hypothetical protein